MAAVDESDFRLPASDPVIFSDELTGLQIDNEENDLDYSGNPVEELGGMRPRGWKEDSIPGFDLRTPAESSYRPPSEARALENQQHVVTHSRKIIIAAKDQAAIPIDIAIQKGLAFAPTTICLVRMAPVDWLCDVLQSAIFGDVQEILGRADIHSSHLEEIPRRAPASFD